MGHFSGETSDLPGSALSGNQYSIGIESTSGRIAAVLSRSWVRHCHAQHHRYGGGSQSQFTCMQSLLGCGPRNFLQGLFVAALILGSLLDPIWDLKDD